MSRRRRGFFRRLGRGVGRVATGVAAVATGGVIGGLGFFQGQRQQRMLEREQQQQEQQQAVLATETLEVGRPIQRIHRLHFILLAIVGIVIIFYLMRGK